MAVTLDKFIAATGAEIIGDRLVAGTMAARRHVGDITGGAFSLNEEGQKLVEVMEAKGDVAAAVATAPVKKDNKPAPME